MADQPSSKKMDNLSKFAALIMTAVGIISGINSYQIGQLDSKISATESKNKWDFKVYDSVVEVVNSKDSGKILAVKILVEHVASDELKQDLIAIVDDALEKLYDIDQAGLIKSPQQVAADKLARPETKADAEEQPSSAPQEPKAAVANVEWGSWDLDIFWCEESGAGAKAQADQLKYIIEAEGAEGRIRSRILPTVTNKRPGYGVKGYQIRPNQNELDFANEVKQFVSSLTVEEIEFEMKISAQKTPWYLSVFICPNIE